MTSFADLVAESPAERAVRTSGPVPDPPAPEPGKVLTLRLNKAGEWYWHQSNDWRDLQYWEHKAAGSWPEPEPEPEGGKGSEQGKGSERGVARSIAPKATQAATSPAKPAGRPSRPGTPSTRRPTRNSREETGWFPGWGMDWRG